MKWKLSFNAPRFLLRRQPIIDQLTPSLDLHFLEVGAGNLKLSFELLKYYKTGVAVDLNDNIHKLYHDSDNALKVALSVANIDVYDVDVRQRFDSVFVCEVLEHIQDDVSFMQQLNRLTRPGGNIIGSVPCNMGLWSHHDDIVGHVRRYERRELKYKLEQAGYNQVRILSYGYPWIHIFRILRIANSRLSQSSTNPLDDTIKSSENQLPRVLHRLSDLSAIFFNKYTFFLPCLLSRFFYSCDNSDGFVFTAVKSSDNVV